MMEAAEQMTIHKSPLEELHRGAGAAMREQDGWALPSAYGEVSAEYEVVREGGAGLIDLSARGRVEVSGAEAVQFLNGLVSNDVKTLADGAWMSAAFPNPQGRLIASARVMRRGDSYLFDTEAVTHASLFKTLERFTLAGDFRVADRTSETAQLSIQGARAPQVVEAALGREAASVERGRVFTSGWSDASLSIIRATQTGEDGFELFVDAGRAAPLWEALTAAGARPVGQDALEILRIEAGLPRYGVDMDETNVVTEAPLDDAVSYTKGCYVGQEIIARIHWRGHVAKKLTGLVFSDGREVEREAKIRAADGKEIGRITSSAFSPRLGRTIALAYVKYDFLAPGTRARVAACDAAREATVTELPFIRGSWPGAAETPEPGP
ncbi:MAG TPA: aminomethyltransferase family protein [Pyrinomonadaceae bacterium]|jgi:aminomethyltransferase|nr:aminomethyltransferase family protein [Pyrinomonadaceae bacterium]